MARIPTSQTVAGIYRITPTGSFSWVVPSFTVAQQNGDNTVTACANHIRAPVAIEVPDGYATQARTGKVGRLHAGDPDDTR
jgi:hypothetical protein